MKSHYLKCLALFASVLVLFSACKKEFDNYYEPPTNLEPPIYQQLVSNGKFTKFVSLIDKAGYKQTLGAAGYWTIFAPTDSAFQNDANFAAFLQSRNITSVETMDTATAQSIVQYLLVFNAFNKDRLDDYQSNLGWLQNSAFKRRTAYYSGFYKDTLPTGEVVTATASNRNNTGGTNSYYIAADNNNKYIPYFTDAYFSTNGLTSADYQYFYPQSTFTGFNVVNASVTTRDIPAENGVIHIINRVVTPLHSLDEYLRTKPEYSEFRKILDRFMVQFIANADATRRLQVLSGRNENVYVKVFSNLLAFSPNNENHLKLQDNDGQRDGWTMMIPNNDELTRYVNNVLLESYPSVNSLPLNIVADLLNAHMWQTTVWPSKFTSTYNFLGEPSYMNPQTNIQERRILSNGFFYGTNKVNEPNVFSTVYGKAYLNPKFSIMTRLLNMDLRNIITNPNANYTVFMFPNSVIQAQGFNYNDVTNAWSFGTSTNDSNRLNLLRILNSAVIPTPNNELANLGQPGFSGIIGSFGGEYIRFNGNQIITAGTRDRNITVTIDSVKTAKNGRVVYLNNLLHFTYVPVGQHLENLGSAATSEFNLFRSYLINSTAYDAVTKNIVGLNAGSFYTVFVPNNAAIRQAITDGLLPGTPTAPIFNPTSAADKQKVERFIQYHVLDKRSIASDGIEVGSFATLLKNSSGDAETVTVQYPANRFELTDKNGRKANLVDAQSNYLSNRTVIHLINNYLKY